MITGIPGLPSKVTFKVVLCYAKTMSGTKELIFDTRYFDTRYDWYEVSNADPNQLIFNLDPIRNIDTSIDL